MTKHILVLSGTPKTHSFSTALADTYAESAQQQHRTFATTCSARSSIHQNRNGNAG